MARGGRAVTASSISPELERAWRLRWNQRIEEARSALIEIQAARGWDCLAPERAGEHGADALEYFEASLLKGAILRAESQERRGSAILRKADSASERIFGAKPFRLHFELGIDAILEGDLARALDCFMLAERKARNPIEALFAAGNVLGCAAGLSLPRERAEARAVAALEAIPEAELDDAAHALEQRCAYAIMREFHLTGRLADPECPRLARFARQGQAAFSRQWASRLPYAQADADPEPQQTKYIWQGAYRSRTLMGLWIPDDRAPVRAGDAIDRLYLWTWRWMAGDDGPDPEKILRTLDSALAHADFSAESRDNLLFLRNSIGWLSLLEPSLASRLRRPREALRARLARGRGDGYRLLDAEHALIQCLEGKDAADLRRALPEFPAFESVYAAVKAGRADGLIPLALERLRRRRRTRQRAQWGRGVVVDCDAGEVRMPHESRRVRSPRLARLFLALHAQSKVRAADLGFAGESDELGFDARALHNLVSRARRFVPKDALSVRGDCVARGPAWPKIFVIGSERSMDGDRSLVLEAERAEFGGGSAAAGASNARLQSTRMLLGDAFTRNEAQARMGVSKATACRLIGTWLRERRLLRVGSARATVYRWNQELE